MKIVSYNISDSYPWKIERLLKMQADVLVVPEITCPEDAHLPDDYEMCWKGISYFFQFRRWKGLGILWRKGLGYIPDWYNPNHFYAIPLIIGDILILAIWPTKREKITGKVLCKSLILFATKYLAGVKILRTGRGQKDRPNRVS